MKTIELFGGPLDGARVTVDDGLRFYKIVTPPPFDLDKIRTALHPEDLPELGRYYPCSCGRWHWKTPA